MSVQSLADLEDRLRKIGCPYCLNTRFSIVLRCDLARGDRCLLVGECQHCNAKFDIETVATFEEMANSAERRFSSYQCACGGPAHLEFLCDLETEDCYFEAVCSHCGCRWRVLPVEAGG